MRIPDKTGSGQIQIKKLSLFTYAVWCETFHLNQLSLPDTLPNPKMMKMPNRLVLHLLIFLPPFEKQLLIFLAKTWLATSCLGWSYERRDLNDKFLKLQPKTHWHNYSLYIC